MKIVPKFNQIIIQIKYKLFILLLQSFYGKMYDT